MRKKIFLFVIICLLSGYLFASDYNVGDKGPAGGWVFYDCDADNQTGNPDNLISSECGWRYLEAAPADLAEKYPWGNVGHFDLPEFVGVGKKNTEIIINRCTALTDNAAKACADYKVNGFDDWFLPSYGELLLIYENLYKKQLGVFNKRDTYWSSTEDGGETELALGFCFGKGRMYDDDRLPALRVRPVRSFL